MTIPLPWSRLPGSDTERRDLWTPAEDNFLEIAQQFPLSPSPANFQRVPQARVYNSANIAIATFTSTTITFDSENYDFTPPGVSGQHDIAGANTDRLTCRVPGLYRIAGQAMFSSSATGDRQVWIELNGSTILASPILKAAGSFETELVVTTDYRLAVGDFARLRAFHNAGVGLDLVANPSRTPALMWHWISP